MENAIKEKSFKFAIRIVNLYKYLSEKKKEKILSKQLIRSGTSIGANVAEAEQAQSSADFISKMSIALKESAESKYWLSLLYETEFLSKDEYESIVFDCAELEKILVSIIKTTKKNIEQNQQG